MADGGRFLSLRYDGMCLRCRAALSPRSRAWWDPIAKTVECTACRPEVSMPGASAQAIATRRRENHQQQVRQRHARLGGVILAFGDQPQGVTAWAKGADGERRLGRVLDDVVSENVRVLHDRRIPGSRANIDHLAVTPEGVFVIDAKHHRGPVGLRDKGTLLRATPTLVVNGRDQTKLVDGMWPQVDAVRDVVGPGVPIHPVLCFIDVEWLTWSQHFELDRVLVTAWKPLRRRLTRSRSWTDQIDAVAAQLARALEPATARKTRVRPPA